jgi:hypothetical protein
MKKKEPILIGLCIASFFYNVLQGVTEVYNLRVSNITSARIELDARSGQKKEPPTIFTSKIATRLRRGQQGVNDLLIADISNIIYSYKNWYVRADGAFGYVRKNSPDNPPAKHTQTDDILLWAGYRHMINKQLHLAYTALCGIPTHKDYRFEFFQFGTGHYGLGGQLDMILKYDPTAWLAAVRYVHFFNAKSTVIGPPCQSVVFSLGNRVDMIVAYYRLLRTDHSLEIGYNPTFNFSRHTNPPLDPVVHSYSISNSWYSIYRYAFTKREHPMSLGLSASYGFDIVGSTTRNIAWWISYSIKF